MRTDSYLNISFHKCAQAMPPFLFSAILFVGVLAFLPGGYQSFILYNTWKRKPGYRVEDSYEAVDV